MRFEVLGPLRVLDGDGRSLRIGGTRERSLLARLLISANHVVTVDRLIDDLWDDAPPPTARQSLHVHLSRLRKTLGPDRIVTEGPGYRIVVDNSELDAARFEELVAEARARSHREDHRGSASLLREALSLWRGSVLADVADRPFASAEAARLEEARLAALEARIDADLAVGLHADLVGELEALTGAHPLRERLWRARMLALYRAGRQAEALRAYQDVRRLLADELGIDPSAELRDLERAVLAQDPALMLTRVVSPASERSFPPALQAMRDGPFVGRDAELDRLWNAYEASIAGRPQTVLITGEAGIGKSRLAAELAWRAHEAGALVFYGRWDEHLRQGAQPIESMIRTLVGAIADDELSFEGVHELQRTVPELRMRRPDLPPPTDADPATRRRARSVAIQALIAHASRRFPVVGIADDLHWNDDDWVVGQALGDLGAMLRSGEPIRWLGMATFRDRDARPALRSSLASLQRVPGFERIALMGLDGDAIAALLDAARSDDLDAQRESLTRRLLAETGGNPFFVERLVRHIAAGGEGIPASIGDVVAGMLAGLAPATNALLDAAAVAAPSLDLAVLRQLAEGDAVAALDDALRARVLVEGGPARFAFAHDLIREAIDARLTSVRRIALHARVGTALASLPDADAHAEEIAQHFVAAVPLGYAEPAARWSLEAGGAVLSRSGAVSDALWHFERGLEAMAQATIADTAVRGQLYEGVALCRQSLGELDAASAASERAEADARASAFPPVRPPLIQ